MNPNRPVALVYTELTEFRSGALVDRVTKSAHNLKHIIGPENSEMVTNRSPIKDFDVKFNTAKTVKDVFLFPSQ